MMRGAGALTGLAAVFISTRIKTRLSKLIQFFWLITISYVVIFHFPWSDQCPCFLAT